MALTRSRIATLRRASDGLLVVVVVVVLFGVLLGRLVPMTGRQTLIIGGGSMAPAIPLGAAIVIDPVAPADLAVGDVVSLRTGPELRSIFTHRITRVVSRADGLWIETKGDANAEVDPSITPAGQVIGRVTTTIPYAGYLLALLSIPSGIALVLLIAGFLLALSWLLETFELEAIERAGTGQPIPGAVDRGSPLPIRYGLAGRSAQLRRRRGRRFALDPAAQGGGSLSAAPATHQASPAARPPGD